MNKCLKYKTLPCPKHNNVCVSHIIKKDKDYTIYGNFFDYFENKKKSLEEINKKYKHDGVCLQFQKRLRGSYKTIYFLKDKEYNEYVFSDEPIENFRFRQHIKDSKNELCNQQKIYKAYETLVPRIYVSNIYPEIILDEKTCKTHYKYHIQTIMDKINGSSVKYFIEPGSNFKDTLNKNSDVFESIFEHVAGLHKQNVLHRDLHADNIIYNDIDGTDGYKGFFFIDFGLSSSIEEWTEEELIDEDKSNVSTPIIQEVKKYMKSINIQEKLKNPDEEFLKNLMKCECLSYRFYNYKDFPEKKMVVSEFKFLNSKLLNKQQFSKVLLKILMKKEELNELVNLLSEKYAEAALKVWHEI